MAFIQRNYPRIDIQFPVKITVNGCLLEGAKCVNISMGGMCIQVDETVEEQQTGFIEIEHYCDDGKVTFKGDFVIRWINSGTSDKPEKRFGLQFTYYDSNNLTNLARIIITGISKNEVNR